MRRTLTAAEPGVRAEQRSLADLLGDPTGDARAHDDYRGAGPALVDAALARAATTLTHPAPSTEPLGRTS
jgi:hypothetical protein